MMHPQKRQQSFSALKILSVWVVFGVVLAVALIWHAHREHIAANTSAADTVQTAKPVPDPNSTVTNQAPTPATNVPGGSTGNTDTDTVVLAAPSGTFVSNHRPAIGATDGRNIEKSTCTTTVGAGCEIQFTKGSLVKSLSALNVETDRGGQTGTATWNNWTPESVGLEAGEWKVTAIAKLGSQTKTANDALSLVVSP